MENPFLLQFLSNRRVNFNVYAWNTLCIVTLEPYIFTGETYYISLLTGAQGWGKETGGQRKTGNPATRGSNSLKAASSLLAYVCHKSKVSLR